MSLLINEECINCGACEPECPNKAIYAAGEEYELKVDLLPPWPSRALTANLRLKTGISEAPEDTINVYARITPRVSADRSLLPQTE